MDNDGYCCEYYKEDVIIFDVETTGMNPKVDRIVELAMSKVQTNGLIDNFDEYFNPCMSREKQLGGFKVHKISPDELLTKKQFKSYAQEILDFIGETKYLVGHNVSFDWDFLIAEFYRAEIEWRSRLEITLVDTLKLSIVTFPNLSSYKLQSISEHLDINIERRSKVKYKVTSPKKVRKIKLKEVMGSNCYHSAIGDVLVTKELLNMLVHKLLNGHNQKVPVSLAILEKHFVFYDPSFLELLDSMTVGSVETYKEVVEGSKMFMSTLKSSRGKLLKDIKYHVLLSEIGYLKKDSVNNSRGIRLRELVLSEREDPMKRKHVCITGDQSQLTEFYQQKKIKLNDVEKLPGSSSGCIF